MVGALAKALAAAGHQTGVVTPLYSGIRERFPKLRQLDWQMKLPMGSLSVSAEVYVLHPQPRLTCYFIQQPHYYARKSLYQANGDDYPDNPERFIFLSKAVAHLARYLPWQPELVHVHDWQVGLTPLLIRHQEWREGWGRAPKTCLTLHNLAYQGACPAANYQFTNLPWDYFHIEGAEFFGQLNFVKAGISFADEITTVSPRYAREIQTEEFGAGLDGLLRRREDAVIGILNGVDYTEWNTTHNPNLKHPYNLRNLKGKTANKKALQKHLGLPVSAQTPMFGNIGRLVEQKGIDLLIPALELVLTEPIQFVSLGAGHSKFEAALSDLARRFPDKVAVRLGYEEGLPHQIEAGCDFYLMPSRFEPCGLNQLYSLHYGTIPIVRSVGGLDDSVIDLREDPIRANGIKFSAYSVPALAQAIRKALVLFGVPTLMHHLRQNGMQTQFSWKVTAEKYVAVYQKVLDS